METKQVLPVILFMVLAVTGGLVITSLNGSAPDEAQVQGAQIETYRDTNSSINNQTMSQKVDMYSVAPPVLSAEELADKTAKIATSKGDIVIELNGEAAPATVSNFIFLANDKFYDGLTFHRREEGFVVQGGDPAGNGSGGPGYTVEAEIDNGLTHERGAVAMARLSDFVNPEKESSGSQFYITLGDADFLNGEYTVFGKVISGMEVVDSLEVGDVMNSVTIE